MTILDHIATLFVSSPKGNGKDEESKRICLEQHKENLKRIEQLETELDEYVYGEQKTTLT